MTAVVKSLRRLWVGSGWSGDQEAAVQRHQRLKGGLLSHCRPTPGKRPTAAKAEIRPDASGNRQLVGLGLNRSRGRVRAEPQRAALADKRFVLRWQLPMLEMRHSRLVLTGFSV